MANIFRKYEIKYVLLNGGNGTMDTYGCLYEACRDADIRISNYLYALDKV